MSTNPLGKGTKNLTVNVPVEMRERLEQLALASGMPLSQYIRAILNDAMQSETNVSVEVTIKRGASRSESTGEEQAGEN